MNLKPCAHCGADVELREYESRDSWESMPGFAVTTVSLTLAVHCGCGINLRRSVRLYTESPNGQRQQVVNEKRVPWERGELRKTWNRRAKPKKETKR